MEYSVQRHIALVQQSESALGIHLPLFFWISLPFRSPQSRAELPELSSGFSLVQRQILTFEASPSLSQVDPVRQGRPPQVALSAPGAARTL